MADMEKITINMSVVDLGHVDLLVNEGFYSNRTDFIRTAIRNQLATHAEAVNQTLRRKTLVVGVVVYNKAELEQVQASGEQIDLKVVGLLHLSDDITPELARATIASVQVFGIFRANDAVKKSLAERIR